MLERSLPTQIRSCAAAAALAACLFPAGASAQEEELSTCSNPEDAVLTTAPELARSGEEMIFTTQTELTKRITNATLTIFYRKQERIVPIAVARKVTEVIELAPEGSGSVVETKFDWDQDAGRNAACHGVTRYTLPLIPAEGKAGNLGVPRFEGLFLIRYEPLPTKSPVGEPLGPSDSKWRLRPRCAYFGCSTAVRSSQGLKGLFRPDRVDRYVLRKRAAGVGDCKVTVPAKGKNNFKTVTIKRAFIFTRVLRLEATRVTDGRVRELSGRLKDVLRPTPKARRRGCDRAFFDNERVTGEKIKRSELAAATPQPAQGRAESPRAAAAELGRQP